MSPKGKTSGVGGAISRLAGANIVGAIGAAITTPVFTHELGVHGQGVIAGATAPLLFLSTAATLGIPTAVTYALAKIPTLARSVVWRATMVTILTGAVATLLVILFAADLTNGHRITQSLMVIASIFTAPTLILGVLSAAAAGMQRWTMITVQQILVGIATVSGTAILAITGALTEKSATLVVAGAPMVGAVAYLPMTSALSRLSMPDRQCLRSLRLASYAARVWLGAIGGLLLERLDQALMTALSTPRQLGLYSVAVIVSEAPLIFNSAVTSVVFAVEAASQDDERLTRAGRLSTLVVVSGSVLIALGSYALLGPIFGAGFRHAYAPLLVLLAAVAVGNPGSAAGAGLSARGHPGLRSIWLTVACLTSLATVVVLVPPLGAMGAAIGTFVGNLTAGGLALAFVWHHEGIAPSRFLVVRVSDVRTLFSMVMSRA